MSQPVQIFIAYSRKDRELLDQFRGHLSPYERNGMVRIWYDGEIEIGASWDADIKKHLHEADIIILMVSSDAINSDYFYTIEMTAALERHNNGEARVVPLIARPCAWYQTPLGSLQALPREGKPVTTWTDRDEAFTDAATRIGQYIEGLMQNQQPPTPRPISTPTPPPPNPPNLKELQSTGLQLIANNKIKEFFQLFSDALHPDSEATVILILQRSSYNRTSYEDLNNIISHENARMQYAQVNNALLHLVSNLQDEDLKTH